MLGIKLGSASLQGKSYFLFSHPVGPQRQFPNPGHLPLTLILFFSTIASRALFHHLDSRDRMKGHNKAKTYRKRDSNGCVTSVLRHIYLLFNSHIHSLTHSLIHLFAYS